MIYLTHEKHGVHIAYDNGEIERCKASGWVVVGPRPPGEAKPKEPEIGVDTDIAPKKRGRPRKAD